MWLMIFNVLYYGVFIIFFTKMLLHFYLDLTSDEVSVWDMGSSVRMIFKKYSCDESGTRGKIKRVCNFFYSIYAIVLIPVILIKTIISS